MENVFLYSWVKTKSCSSCRVLLDLTGHFSPDLYNMWRTYEVRIATLTWLKRYLWILLLLAISPRQPNLRKKMIVHSNWNWNTKSIWKGEKYKIYLYTKPKFCSVYFGTQSLINHQRFPFSTLGTSMIYNTHAIPFLVQHIMQTINVC